MQDFPETIGVDEAHDLREKLEAAGAIKMVEDRNGSTLLYDPATTNVRELTPITVTYSILQQKSLLTKPVKGLSETLKGTDVERKDLRGVRSGVKQSRKPRP